MFSGHPGNIPYICKTRLFSCAATQHLTMCVCVCITWEILYQDLWTHFLALSPNLSKQVLQNVIVNFIDNCKRLTKHAVYNFILYIYCYPPHISLAPTYPSPFFIVNLFILNKCFRFFDLFCT